MTTRRPNKLLGQNFLTCEWVLPALAKAADLQPSDLVLEVGPGTGVLTRFLAARAKKVISVEKDRALSASLSVALAQEKISNVEIITGDILRWDFSVLQSCHSRKSGNPEQINHGFPIKSGMTILENNGSPKNYKVVANIPYYLTSRLIRVLLEQEHKPQCIVLTIQKEVAERIVAKPPNMSILALSVQAYGTPEIIAEVPASCFSPQPKVHSAILKISDISEDFFAKHAIAPKDFFAVIKAGFSSRRKVLTTTLESFASKKDLIQALNSIGHPPTARPQELSLAEWVKIILLLKLP